MSRRFRNRSARHFGTGQGISPAMRSPVKRAFNDRAEQDMARANRRVAGTTKQDLAGITIRATDMGGGWEFYVTRGKQGGFEWYLFDPSGELETVRFTNSIDMALEVAERVIENRRRSQSITDEEREQMMRDNEEYLRGLKGGSRRSNHKVARDWDDTISDLLWHFDALYGEVGDEAISDFLWGTDSYGLQYEFDAFMKSAPSSVRERALSRIKTMFKFLKTSHRANRRVSNNDDLNDIAGDYALEVFSSVDAGLLVDWFYGVNVPDVDNAVAQWTTDYDMVELVHDHIEYLIMTNLPYERMRVERVTRS